jgi:prephenate dehydrogenase
MERIAILGLGLMGGSLGAALARRPGRGTRAGYARREATRRVALQTNIVDEVFDDPGPAVRGAGLVVCCVPILAIPELLGRVRNSLGRGCVVTDVGSTKAEVCSQAERILLGTEAVFVGSHPIAGSEQQGLAAARPDLYDQALAVVCRPSRAGPEADQAVREVCSLWRRVGARVQTLDAAEHDALLARTSHLPHVVAATLAQAVCRGSDPERIGAFCGAGYRDTTRIAEGAPTVWVDILRTNRQQVLRELESFVDTLDQLKRSLGRGEFGAVAAYLAQGRSARQQTLNRNGQRP